MTVSPGFDNRIGTMAARQASAFSRKQALAAGATDPMIARRLRSGRWTRAHPGVYVLTGSSPSWIQDLWCAWLAAGPSATVTHESALRLQGVERAAHRPITLTVPHGSHARVAGVIVHQIDDLAPTYITSMNGLPVSRAARAVVEVAATVGERRLGAIVDDVVWGRRASLLRVSACLRQVARPGKPGIGKLARVLDARSDGPVPPGSDLERTMFGALAAWGLPAPDRQTPLPGRGLAEGLVDASYRDARVILEADGRRWHTRIRDLAKDHVRDAEAARVGWETLRFVYEQIVEEPEEVCATVADVRSVRLALFDPRLRAGLDHAEHRPGPPVGARQ
jgi:Protein of unknown function (DUF559)/Transcriptional regulator, AbiEi antitoxin